MTEVMTIWMDDREPKRYVKLFNKLGWWVKYKRIPKEIGYDYIWNNVGVERKTINDFMGSVQDDEHHMWVQLNRMSADDYYSYLIIDGKVYEELDQGRYTYQQFYGAKGSIDTRYVNIRFDTAHNEQAFVYLLHKIFTAHMEGKYAKQRDVMISHAHQDDAMTEILSLIPNMGTKSRKIVSELDLIELHDICELVDRKKEFIAIRDVGPKTFDNMKKKFKLGEYSGRRSES